jgi:hypothetical protein
MRPTIFLDTRSPAVTAALALAMLLNQPFSAPPGRRLAERDCAGASAPRLA